MRFCLLPILPILPILTACAPGGSAPGGTPREPVDVTLARVPLGGLQPEVAVDGQGTVHLVFLVGEPSAADVFYARSTDGGRTFSEPVQVNSQPGSAIATGTVRGAQVAVGRAGRVHVVWNGSSGVGDMGMFYTRSQSSGTAFEPQRNVMTTTKTLDGGGSIAADVDGRVFVAWHANLLDGPDGEEDRRVFLARSIDDGATFDTERPVSDPATGVCGCCALRLTQTSDALQVLYRAATDLVHRDIYSLTSYDQGQSFLSDRLDGWEIGACPMTSSSMAASASGMWRAWETDGEIHVSVAGPAGTVATVVPSGEGESRGRKHPRLASLPDGATLLVWTEGTAWARGGSIAWQVFDSGGQPVGRAGSADGLPVWSFAAAVPRPDGGLTILY